MSQIQGQNWWDPFSGFRHLQRELERWMGFGRGLLGEARRIGGTGYPAVNVYDGQDDVVVQCEVPGVAKDDLDISLTGDTLTVRGVRKPPAEVSEAEGRQVRFDIRERGMGEFNRTIVLPDSVSAENVEADLDAGILTVRLPKTESAKVHKVPIR
ncbi:MAG: Hsp20/alpha crystallin family protein [Phycisphaerae bacterium]